MCVAFQAMRLLCCVLLLPGKWLPPLPLWDVSQVIPQKAEKLDQGGGGISILEVAANGREVGSESGILAAAMNGGEVGCGVELPCKEKFPFEAV